VVAFVVLAVIAVGFFFDVRRINLIHLKPPLKPLPELPENFVFNGNADWRYYIKDNLKKRGYDVSTLIK
jgi:hypothetical protein